MQCHHSGAFVFDPPAIEPWPRQPGNPTRQHTDGEETGRVRLRCAAFIDECPVGSGGYTIWKGSHVPIWAGLWGATRRAPVVAPSEEEEEVQSVWVPKTPKNTRLTQNNQNIALDPAEEEEEEEEEEGKPKHVSQQSNMSFDGYKDEVMTRIKQNEPVEVAGPAGTVVLWHGVLAHVSTITLIMAVNCLPLLELTVRYCL